jgi:hypothetical protein
MTWWACACARMHACSRSLWCRGTCGLRYMIQEHTIALHFCCLYLGRVLMGRGALWAFHTCVALGSLIFPCDKTSNAIHGIKYTSPFAVALPVNFLLSTNAHTGSFFLINPLKKSSEFPSGCSSNVSPPASPLANR